MSRDRLKYLFKVYFEGTATPEETAELSELVSHADDQDLSRLLQSGWKQMDLADEVIPPHQANEILQKILSLKTEPTPVITLTHDSRKRQWKYLAAAVSVIIITCCLFLFVDEKSSEIPQTVTKQPATDLVPGQNGAILTLSNGQTIILDSAKDGLLATQGSSKVIHANGQIRYQADSGSSEVEVLNTITTPKGRQFHITLSDGSKVWLNAASSIRYPSTFNTSIRNVIISGEVYFEIAPNAAKPFRISIEGKKVIEVLGTHFNVNAYADEPTINTTLLEGSIKIVSAATGESRILKAGQQAQLKGKLHVTDNIDVNEVMAWKNGYFSFNGASTEAIMRQVMRWYDAEVIYEGDVKDERFAGTVPRSGNASKLLEVLELTKTLKFKIEGRKIIVTPYTVE